MQPISVEEFRKLLAEKVLIYDGAMGTNLQTQGLTSEDFGGHDGCSEALNLYCPEAVIKVHRGFLEVGCHVLETNTFGGTRITLREYGLESRVEEINRRAAAANLVNAQFVRLAEIGATQVADRHFHLPAAWREDLERFARRGALQGHLATRLNREGVEAGLPAAEKAGPEGGIRILLTTGGHAFEEDAFYAMFDAMRGIEYTKAELPKDAGLLKPGLEKQFDCIVMYDMCAPAISPEQRKAFVELLTTGGIGLVSLTVQAVDTILRKVNPALFKAFGVYLVLVIANCVIIAVPLTLASAEYNAAESFMLIGTTDFSTSPNMKSMSRAKRHAGIAPESIIFVLMI